MFFMNDASAQGVALMRIDDFTRISAEIFTLMPSKPKQNVAFVECQAIFEALIKNGKEHFSQASNTPFASGPITEHLGPYEFNEYSQQIL
jgi:hypothetical protein